METGPAPLPPLRILRSPALLCASLTLAGSMLSAQGDNGFLRGRGKLDVATSWSREHYDSYHLENPAQAFDDLERSTLDLYAAYGLCEDMDLVAKAAWVSTSSDPGSGFTNESDFQDASLQLKWRPDDPRAMGSGTFSWLLAPGIRFPLADYDDYSENPLKGLGSGDTVLLGRLIAQYQWSASYVALETGYDHRNGPLDDEIPVHLSLGTTWGRTTLQLFYSNILALGDAVSSPRYTDDRDGWVRVGLGAFVRVTEWFGVSMNARYSDEGNDNDSTGVSFGTVFRL